MPKQNTEPSYFEPEPDTLVLEDQSLQYGFIQLPKQILYARNLSRDAKFLYAVLLGYAWQKDRCFPGYRRLCADMQASENMVRKYMRELEAVKLLSQKRRGLGRTNLYKLHDLRTSKIEVQEPQETAAPEPAKSEGKVEEVEIKTERIEPSNIRKPSTSKKNDKTPPLTPMAAANSEREATSRVSPVSGMEPLSAMLTRQPTPAPSYDDDRQQILSYLEDFARELGDRAPLKSSVTRAYHLYQRTGKPIGIFIDALYQARAITKERSASIRRTTESGGVGSPKNPKNKTAYFFAVLEDQLGLKAEENEKTYPRDHNT
jgi:Helix-turn-helix domain